jgi:hypothetical protein
MAGMGELASIRQAATNRSKMALIMAVATIAMTGLYLQKHSLVPLWIPCLWAATSIFNVFVYRAHKRKLKTLGSN